MHMYTVRGGLVCPSIHHGFEQQTYNNKVSALMSFCFDFYVNLCVKVCVVLKYEYKIIS
jgi:hypothetical protein